MLWGFIRGSEKDGIRCFEEYEMFGLQMCEREN